MPGLQLPVGSDSDESEWISPAPERFTAHLETEHTPQTLWAPVGPIVAEGPTEREGRTVEHWALGVERGKITPPSVDIGQAVGGWWVPREGAFGPDFEIGVAVDRLRWGEKIPRRGYACDLIEVGMERGYFRGWGDSSPRYKGLGKDETRMSEGWASHSITVRSLDFILQVTGSYSFILLSIQQLFIYSTYGFYWGSF